LKEQFTKKLVLAAPDIDKKMRMEVDVSDYVTGRVSRSLTVDFILFFLFIFILLFFLFPF